MRVTRIREFSYKMINFLLSTVTLVVSLESAFSASIPTYELDTNENIQSNLIGYGDGTIEGLTPPKLVAQDHYSPESGKSSPEPKNPYVVEITGKFLKFQTTGFPAQYIKLTKTESEGIRNLSLAVVELLDNSQLSSPTGETPDWGIINPIFTLSNSGISLRFNATAENDPEGTDSTDDDKQILWDFLTKYARNIFLEKVKELNAGDQYEDALEPSGESSPFRKFLDSLWRIMRLSVDYAESNFGGWTTPSMDATTEEVEEKSRSTVATIFAFEEPSGGHAFPSQEFDHRGKDLEALFYGRGIV